MKKTKERDILMKISFTLIMMGLIFISPLAYSEEIILESGVHDTTIFSESNNSDGMGTGLFVGKTAKGQLRRALVSFDLASIPTGSTIQGAELDLTVSKTISSSQPVTAHRLLAEWSEGTANAPGQEGAGTPAGEGDTTWSHRVYSTAAWGTPGGDFQPEESGTGSAGNTGAQAQITGAKMAEDVQLWIMNPALNFGWILLGNETDNASAKRFHSTNDTSASAGQRPRLIIQYTPPTGVHSWEIY